MESKINENTSSTKENEKQSAVSGVFLSRDDAEEYRTYRKRKKLTEVSAAMSRSEGSLLGGEDIQRACERAIRLRQAAVKVPLSKLSQAGFYLSGSGVKLDCLVGGNGETLAKVKGYEAKLAVKRNAKEITLVLTPSLLDNCRYGEIRREIKRVRRAARKSTLKVGVEKVYAPTVLARLARICSDIGVKYFSVPYFAGCERLRMDLTNGCLLEVCGVETTADFRKTIGAGVGRIVTERGWEVYSEWLKEANETPVLPVMEPKKESEKESEKPSEAIPPLKTIAPPVPIRDPEKDYRCRLEGTQLKFL